MKSFYSLLLSAVSAFLAIAVTSGSHMPKPTIVQIAASDPNFSTLVAAVEAAGLVDVLSGKGPFSK